MIGNDVYEPEIKIKNYDVLTKKLRPFRPGSQEAFGVGLLKALLLRYQPVDGQVSNEDLTRCNSDQNLCIEQTWDSHRITYPDPNQKVHFENPVAY